MSSIWPATFFGGSTSSEIASEIGNQNATSTLLDTASKWFFGSQQVQPSSSQISKQAVTTEENQELTTLFQNTLASSPCWKELTCNSPISLTEGPKACVQSFYTEFSNQIRPVKSRTIQQFDERIFQASWLGAHPWDGKIWFTASSPKSNTVGLIAVEDSPEGANHYFPLKEKRNPITPMFIPSHSIPGEEGHVCVFESQLNHLGFSIWDINSKTPKNLLDQQGFGSIKFFGNDLIFGYRQATKTLECWSAKKQQLEYSIKNLRQNDHLSMNLGPYNSNKQILLGNDGSYVYGFDLNKKELAFTIELKSQGGLGGFHTLIDSEQELVIRERSTEMVHVYDVVSGEKLHEFPIGGGYNKRESDDYPMRIAQDTLFALKADDRKTICARKLKSGEIKAVFEPAEFIISDIFCTTNRVIGVCYASVNPGTDAENQVVIWDKETKKIIKKISPPKGYSISPRDLSNRKLTLRLEEDDSEETSDLQKRLELKTNSMKAYPKAAASSDLQKPLFPTREGLDLPQKNYMPSTARDEHWSADKFMFLEQGQLRLDIWDIEKCEFLGSIQEKFHPLRDLITANYSDGKLVVDNKAVLLQEFRV